MADQAIHYLTLLDDIAKIDPSTDHAKELARLSAGPVSQSDALDLLLLAEQAACTGEWQAAAQLFSLMMVSSFSERYSEAEIVEHAMHIILLTTGHETKLRSTTDLLLYGHRRLTAVLREDGIQQAYLDEWKVSALSQLLRGSEERIAEMQSAKEELNSDNTLISQGYQSQIWPTRKLLSCSLARCGKNDGVSNKGLWHLPGLGLAVVVVAILAFELGDRFPLPVSAALDSSWAGSLLRGAIIAWPLLLIATWLFAFFESRRTHTYQYISPIHLLGREKIIAGQIVPFSRDLFFHIFQFVWIALMVIAWLLFRKYQELPGWLPSVYPPAIHPPAWVGSWNYSTAFWGNDMVALAAATGTLAYAIWLQLKIQRDRKTTSTDFYWWDRRVNPTEWWIRLIMVCVDLFLAFFLLAKILVTLVATYVLVLGNVLKVSIFSPDGVGGLKDLTDVLMYLSWIVFLFGLFVVASLYLHWWLRAYRNMDLTLVTVYVGLLVVMVLPLGILNSKLSAEKDASVQQLARPGEISGKKLDDVAKYVQNVNSVNDWRVSAIKIGILGNGVLPLGFQFLVILVQFLGRAGRLPKFLIPFLGGKGATEGGHDEH